MSQGDAAQTLEQRARDIFMAAVDLAGDARAAFVRARCGDDAALAREVDALFAADAEFDGHTLQPALPFAQALADLDPNHTLVGTTVGAYRLTALLGRGGMGSVYRAERSDGTLDHVVAIKFLRRDVLGPHTLQRFRLERQLLAGLDHPGIAKLLDANELPDGTPYFVMEHVVGQSITGWCDTQRLTLRARLHLFVAVCRAVEHAHQRLIVHRDIKAGNILVDHAGQPKLLDFGIAKPLDATMLGGGEETATAHRFFSPATAAPEQIAGGAITVACDVYALGNLLYGLLAGTGPFDLDDISLPQAERILLEAIPPAPSARAAEAPLATATARGLSGPKPLVRVLRGDLDGIVLRCLRKAPAERYASVEQLREDVENYLDGRPVRARHGHRLYRLRKFLGRNRVSVAISAAASIALLAAGGLLLAQNVALVHERDRATLERDRATYVRDILKQAFASADPTRAAGGEVTARQILDGARSQIEASYEHDPALYASLAETIASAQYSMRLAPQAVELSSRALDAARRSGATSQQIQDLLLLHAQALISAGREKEAAPHLDEAATLGAASRPIYALARARYLMETNEPAQAVAQLRPALAATAAAPPTDAVAADLRAQYAEALGLTGDSQAALSALDEALAWQQAGMAEDHASIALTRLHRVQLLRRAKRNDEALSEARSVVDTVRLAFGEQSAFAAVALSELGLAQKAAGQQEESIATYRTALAAWERALGPTHPNTIRSTFNLAELLVADTKHWDEAEAHYRKAFQLGLSRYGPASEMVTYLRLNYADLLRRRERGPEAVDLLVSAEAGVGYAKTGAGNRKAFREVLADAVASPSCTRGDHGATQERCAVGTAWLRQHPD